MDSIKKGSGSEGLNGKLAYDPPKAMRLDDMREGEGASCISGSGNANCQSSGNSASFSCTLFGNSGPT
jgi:hypothetical protein